MYNAREFTLRRKGAEGFLWVLFEVPDQSFGVYGSGLRVSDQLCVASEAP